MHLSAGFSRLCLREEVPWKADNEETGSAIGEGTEGEFKIPECENEGF